MMRAVLTLVLLYSFTGQSADVESLKTITGYYEGKRHHNNQIKPDVLKISIEDASLVIQWYPSQHSYKFAVSEIGKYFFEKSGDNQKSLRFCESVEFKVSDGRPYDLNDESLRYLNHIEVMEFKFVDGKIQRMRFQDRETPEAPADVTVFNELVKHDLKHPPTFEFHTNKDW
ncbi:MAG TPA: hypothetical protein VEL47_04100 [Myxococcota bacterium]|nr:hypothetical protein [Myxococcota bacterium]